MENFSELVTKTNDDLDKNVLKTRLRISQKKSNTRKLVKKTDHKTKITDIENKIPSVTGLVTTAALNTVVTKIKKKIPDKNNRATKAGLNTKATDIEKNI